MVAATTHPTTAAAAKEVAPSPLAMVAPTSQALDEAPVEAQVEALDAAPVEAPVEALVEKPIEAHMTFEIKSTVIEAAAAAAAATTTTDKVAQPQINQGNLLTLSWVKKSQMVSYLGRGPI